jgi:kynurenine formamidase
MSTHSGTHLDAPEHFTPNEKTLDAFVTGEFILPAR